MTPKNMARVVRFGRKINLSESPLVFIELLRRLVDGEVTPVEGVKSTTTSSRKPGFDRTAPSNRICNRPPTR